MNDRPPPNRRSRRWLIAVAAIGILFALSQVIVENFRDEEHSLRRQFRKSVEEWFPEQAAVVKGSYGLRPFKTNADPRAADNSAPQVVVLIHGLDDPGKVWMNLAPALAAKGYRVWIMTYPNDQPLDESARLFFTELKTLREGTVEKIFLVAHSMGGLISRQMLTDPAIDYAEALENRQVPAVDLLVMVGTPNHGSEMARLRGFTEFRDQLARIAEGEGHWLGAILDGAGEAKIDLLPDSRFLRALNARPHPSGVEMVVVAGIASPWDEDDIKTWIHALKDRYPQRGDPVVNSLEAMLLSMTRGLGDGLVTVDSARLAGVPLVMVSGTHLSMIRNTTAASPRIPPAVPVILDHLENRYRR
ncbi:MAG: alpha/beta fold hydrolase [Desulfobacterales bacterium]